MKQKISLSLLLFMLISFLFIPVNVYANESNLTAPKIYGSAAITLDLNTGEIIYAKDIDAENYKEKNNTKGMYPASITKLMTALIFSEYLSNNKLDTLKYTRTAYLQPRYSLHTDYPNVNLKVGKELKSTDVMNALLIYSANDMAYTIAGNLGKTKKYNENSDEAVQNFINKMNDTAKKLKMTNTHFVTANGLHDDEHYTTPYDLTLLGRAAVKNKLMTDTMQTKEAIFQIDGKTIPLENRNKLVGENINGAVCIGGKTGYTSAAGRCLLAIFDKNGHKIIGIVMHSIYDSKDSYVFEDMKKIIDYSYNVNKITYKAKDSVLKNVTLKYKPLIFIGPTKTLNVPLILKQDVQYYSNYVNNKEIKYSIDTKNLKLSNIKSSKPVGFITVSQRENISNYDLYTNITKSQIFKQNLPFYGVTLLIILVIMLLILGIIHFVNTKNKNRRYRRHYR